MNKTLIETINLKKTYKHLNGNITLFNNLNLIKVALLPYLTNNKIYYLFLVKYLFLKIL